MRRGRIITGITICMTAALLGAPAAFADFGKIAQDLADGSLDGTYTQAELRAYLQSATVQGYENPVAVPLPTAGVAGAQKTQRAKAPARPTARVAGAQKTQAPTANPLAETRQVGTLPFTGTDLVLLTGGGLLLLLLGFGVRRLGRHQA